MRKNGSIDFRLNRTSVGDEYGAGPPEVRCVSIVGVLRRGGKRGFSPYLNRGLGGEKKITAACEPLFCFRVPSL